MSRDGERCSNHLCKPREYDTTARASDAHNLTSPSHSRRHSCYYISATTANDALASQALPEEEEEKKKKGGAKNTLTTLAQSKTHALNRLISTCENVAQYNPVG